MASLMDNLVEVLEEENTQYKRLVELSKNKKEAIIKADIAELEEITGMEQDIAVNAQASLAAYGPHIKECVDRFWNTPCRS